MMENLIKNKKKYGMIKKGDIVSREDVGNLNGGHFEGKRLRRKDICIVSSRKTSPRTP